MNVIILGGGWLLLLIGFCWIWSKRQPPSMADRRAEDAAQMAAIAEWRLRSSQYLRARERGDKREMGRLAPLVREANHGRIAAELKLRVVK